MKIKLLLAFLALAVSASAQHVTSKAELDNQGDVYYIKGTDSLFTCVIEDITGSESNVYAAGYEVSLQGVSVAKLWKNGVAQDLSDGIHNAQANSVFVSGNDVYVTGWGKNTERKMIAKVWKNGVAQNMTDGTHDAITESVYISEGDVYVAGMEESKQRISVVKLWKNGVEEIIFEHGGYNHSVYVSGDDIYIAGSAWSPALWKNGAMLKLSIYSGEANSVYVSGNDVYVAGHEMRDLHIETAIVWKNGEKQILDDDEKYNEATSIYVSDGDVYVSGWEGRTIYAVDEDDDIWLNHSRESKVIAKLWKNGTGENLTDGSATAGAYSVYVSNGDVYVGGYEENERNVMVAKVWKNGVARSLTDGNTEANVLGVFVK